MDTQTLLADKYGPLLTLVQLAKLLDRSPEGLRITLLGNNDFARRLKPGRIKIGRRVYFRTATVAELIDGV